MHVFDLQLVVIRPGDRAELHSELLGTSSAVDRSLANRGLVIGGDEEAFLWVVHAWEFLRWNKTLLEPRFSHFCSINDLVPDASVKSQAQKVVGNATVCKARNSIDWHARVLSKIALELLSTC